MCHLVLLLPVFALPVFWLLPLSWATPVYAAVAVVSLIFYSYAFKAMRQPRLNGAEAMVGETGSIVDAGESGATLFFHGELWRADVEGAPLVPGDEALIVGIKGLRLKITRKP